MLEVGTPAPDFTAPNTNGVDITLSAHQGQWVLLWWYPKASTPGWTLQGGGLRDQAQMFQDLGCTILGASFDSPEDNAVFKSSQDFPFDLLSDESREIGAAYEVLRSSDDAYADYPQRISYLIDPQGVVVKAYEVTDPAGHAVEVLADLDAAIR